MSDSANQSRSYVFVWLSSVSIGLALFLTVCVCGCFCVHRPLVDLGRDFKDMLINLLREPGVTVVEERKEDGSSVLLVQGDEGVARLLTTEQTITPHYRYSTTWWGSKKTLIIHADFKVYAGIDLSREPIRIKLGKNLATITCEDIKGRGRIFACEQVGDIVVDKDDDGIWNKLQPEEVARATEQLKKEAQRYAEQQTKLLQEAESNYLDYLRGVEGCRTPSNFSLLQQ